MAPNQSTMSSTIRSSKRGTSIPLTPPADYANMTLAMRKLIGSGCGGRIGGTKKQKLCSPLKSPSTRELFVDVPDEEEDARNEVECNRSAPKASRCIVETDPLQLLISSNCVCKLCGGGMSLTFRSIGIATTPHLECDKCEFQSVCDIETTTLPRGRHPRTSDYAVNCQHVAACISSGDGGTEAGRILGLLDLPNYATMEKHTFPTVEYMMHGKLQDVSKRALEDNLREEVRLSLLQNDDLNYTTWIEGIDSGDALELDESFYATIRGGSDMGWQKRSSGRRYDSLSGHECVFGALTRKPIMMCIKSKFCRVCTSAKRLNKVPKQHKCCANHVDSSGSMEADALLDMIHELKSKWNVHVSHLCTDDDSTMRARVRWGNEDYKRHFGNYPMVEIMKGKNKGKMRIREDTGRLKLCVPQPTFVADPSHRKKTLRNKLYALNNLPAPQKHGFGPADITRIVKNFSYFVNTMSTIDSTQWAVQGRCVLDHHFDDHANCGSFCLRKKELIEKTPEENSNKFYRSKDKDVKLYAALDQIVSGFLTQERLEEVGHGMDTQPNESLNNTIAWKAPKGKTYSGSVSLENRVCMAIATHLIGPAEYFGRCFDSMGIRMRPGTGHYLSSQAKSLTNCQVRQRKIEVKRRRNEKNFTKLRQQLAKLLSDQKAGNVYKPGVVMEVVCGEVSNKSACRCGGTDHHRTSSLKCPKNKLYAIDQLEADQQALLDLVEVAEDANEEETEDTLNEIILDDEDDLETSEEHVEVED